MIIGYVFVSDRDLHKPPDTGPARGALDIQVEKLSDTSHTGILFGCQSPLAACPHLNLIKNTNHKYREYSYQKGTY